MADKTVLTIKGGYEHREVSSHAEGGDKHMR